MVGCHGIPVSCPCLHFQQILVSWVELLAAVSTMAGGGSSFVLCFFLFLFWVRLLDCFLREQVPLAASSFVVSRSLHTCSIADTWHPSSSLIVGSLHFSQQLSWKGR